MTDRTSTSAIPNDLTLSIGEGATAHNMGDGMIAVDQRDETTKTLQRVILARADLERMLAWAA